MAVQLDDARIAKAHKVLTEEAADDYLIEPSTHAALYEKDLPELAGLLRDSSVQAIASAYESADARALDHQKNYKLFAGSANILVAVTAVLGAAVTAAVVLWGNPYLVIFLSVLAALTAGGAAFLLNLLSGGRYLTRWMEARALAETERLAYFKAVTSPDKVLKGGKVDPATYILSFWYFLRYQYQVQAKFYRERGRDHESSAELGLVIAAGAAALGMICSLLVPALSSAIGKWAAVFGVLTVFGTALSGYAAARESMNQDQRNAERYERTADILTKLGARIDEVEAAIVAGNVAVLADFVDAVHEQLSLEHRQWLEAAEGASAAVQKLDEALTAATGELKKK